MTNETDQGKANIAKKIMGLAHEAEKLKTLLRFGITSQGNRESIADHSWRVAFLLILCGPYTEKKKINIERSLKMAIIHDIVEIYAGDAHFLELLDEKQQEIQQQKELEAIKRIAKSLPKRIGNEIYELWMEFENQETYESKLVKALDKLEAYIQQNEADISTWTQDELDSVFYYLDDYCSFDPFINIFKEEVVEESKNKINDFKNLSRI